jgi:hypothetical protein
MRKIISLICFLLPAFASAADADVRPDAPDRHVVVQGDTLWGISNLFFKDPWKWPQLWGANRDGVKDPHWIYPGSVIYLDRTTGRLNFGQGAGGNGAVQMGGVIKLKPQMRLDLDGHEAVPSIPSRAIEPFLAQPLAVEENQLLSAPTIVALQEEREMLGVHDIAYIRGAQESMGSKWQAYLPAKALIDPDTEEVLGHEVIYLGDIDITKFGDPSTARVTKIRQEIGRGARLVEFKQRLDDTYLPRPPVAKISAKIISIYGGMTQASQNNVVTLNKGSRDGLENGHVLALYKAGKEVKYQGDKVQLPDERNGLLFVFRVFNKVSYALVMETRLPVILKDVAKTP